MNIGWIKLHRQILEWEWYRDTNTFRLFLHLLLKANFKDKNHKGKLVKKGFLITGREQLSFETGLSVREIRTCLERLKKTSEIAINSNSKGTEIEILNYDKYQQEADETTNERPAKDQQKTTIEEYKEYKEEKNNIIESFDFDGLLVFINSTFGKKFKLINDKVKKKYKALIKQGYDKKQIFTAIINAKENSYHKETGYQYCTPEFFSRTETIDKYSSITTIQNNNNNTYVPNLPLN